MASHLIDVKSGGIITTDDVTWITLFTFAYATMADNSTALMNFTINGICSDTLFNLEGVTHSDGKVVISKVSWVNTISANNTAFNEYGVLAAYNWAWADTGTSAVFQVKGGGGAENFHAFAWRGLFKTFCRR